MHTTKRTTSIPLSHFHFIILLGNKPAVDKKMSKLNGAPQSLQQQLGNINAQMRRSQNVQSTNWVQGPMSLDEFKYGFPSGGLPSISNKWWGGSCPDEINNEEDDKHHFKVVNDGFTSLIDQDKSESIEEDLQADLQGTRLLTALRRRSVERGREVLKHGNYSHGQSLNKLSKKEQSLLLSIFRSSTPNEWMNNS